MACTYKQGHPAERGCRVTHTGVCTEQGNAALWYTVLRKCGTTAKHLLHYCILPHHKYTHARMPAVQGCVHRDRHQNCGLRKAGTRNIKHAQTHARARKGTCTSPGEAASRAHAIEAIQLRSRTLRSTNVQQLLKKQRAAGRAANQQPARCCTSLLKWHSTHTTASNARAERAQLCNPIQHRPMRPRTRWQAAQLHT